MTASTTLLMPAATLTNDRCDRCNAAARLRITLAGGSELTFCGHHANRYAEDLVKLTVQYVTDPEFTWRGAEMLARA